MISTASLPSLASIMLPRQTVSLAVACRDAAVRRSDGDPEVRAAARSTILAAHVALPLPMLDGAVGMVMRLRAVRLASPPVELLAMGAPRGRLAAQLAAWGILVGVLAGVSIPAPVLAAATG